VFKGVKLDKPKLTHIGREYDEESYPSGIQIEEFEDNRHKSQ
jgi:hypothetical protein